MLTAEQTERILKKEIVYATSRSGGKGGQHVNKVETKVELKFDISTSESLHAYQKALLLEHCPDLIDGTIIQIFGNDYRTQIENKKLAQQKLIVLLQNALRPRKKRIKTKPGKAAKEKKLKVKKLTSEKKKLRKKPGIS